MNRRASVRLIAGCLGLTMMIAGAAEADIGRLFFSKPERAALERARRAAEPAPEAEPEPGPTDRLPLVVDAEPPPEPTIRVDGYVRRSKGQATLWLNGENTYDGDLGASRIEPGSVRLRGGQVVLKPMSTDAPVVLKPGQSYDPNAATTADLYELPAFERESAPN